ncbi:MAG TPA: HEAT repeat domain-containing protein [Planctomycetota bacterium]
MVTILLALVALQEDPEVDAAIAKFRATMNRTKSPVEQATAIHDLAKTPHEKTLAVLTPFVTSGPGHLRAAAIRAVSGFDDKKVLPLLIKSLGANAGEPRAVEMALECLGRLGDEAALPHLQRHLADKDDFVARSAVKAVGALRHASSIDPLIELLKAQEKALANAGSGGVGPVIPSATKGSIRPDASIRKNAEALSALIQESLGKITGQAFKTSADWRTWWTANRATFKVGP